MIESMRKFSVSVEENKGFSKLSYPVFAISREKTGNFFLLSDDLGKFRWVKIEGCKLSTTHLRAND